MTSDELFEMSYEELKAELQNILETLSAGQVSVDSVTELVMRSKVIVTECQKRLKSTREEIEAMIAEVQGGDF